MIYPYQCEDCEKRQELEYSIGKAPRSVPCSCGKTAKRVYSGFAISIGGHSNRTANWGEQIKQRNVAAGKRSRGNKAPVRTVAHDYGNGDVREVK